MKRCLILACCFLIALVAPVYTIVAAPFVEPFNYTNGSLTTVSSQVWSNHSGTVQQLQVVDGKVLMSGSQSEDVNRGIDEVPLVVYAGFDVNFSQLPSFGGAYFAHFKDGSNGFRGRLYAITNGASAGTYRLGLAAAAGTTNVVFPMDLVRSNDYRVVLKWDGDNIFATLWIDPQNEAAPSVSTTDIATTVTVTSFALRQSSGLGTVTLDNLVVGAAFSDVMTNAPVAPQVLINPVSTNVFAGDTVTLTAVAKGTTPLTYQWRRNGTDVSGANESQLVLSGVTAGQAGSYTLFVTNVAGNATSGAAAVAVNDSPTAPRITSAPSRVSTNVGANVTFTVQATGSAPLSYQWFFNNSPLQDGSNYVGAATSMLSINSVRTNQAGSYYVSVMNLSGTTNSATVTLTVNPPITVRTNIAYLRTLQDPITYVPTNTTTLFTIEGIVTTYTNVTTTGNSQFYLQDATAGIAVFVSGASTFRPKAGDLVRVTGPMGHFSGLLELLPVASNPAHSVEILSSGNPLPAPKSFEFSFTNNIVQMETVYEGALVTVSNVTLSGSGNFASGANYTITNSAGGTLILRIDSRVGEIIGQPIPPFASSITGVLAQNTTTPFTKGYQLLPTRLADIVTNSVQIPPHPPFSVAIGKSTNGIFLTWPTTPGATYRVFSTASITNRFDPLSSPITPSNSVGIYRVTNTEPVRFFRIGSP